jgi:hypothetical protein
MGTEHNQHDDAVEKVLAALKTAAPPVGMDTRIAERLRQTQATTTAPPWRNRIVASLPTAAWWRGTLTGAAMATLAITAVLFLQRTTRIPPKPIAAAPSSAPIAALPVSSTAATPCPNPRVLRAHSIAPVFEVPPPTTEMLRSESLARSRPAPAMPLTAQERELSRLVHTAGPTELAMLNSENEARVEAEEAAAFNKFFTPPPQPKIDEDTTSTDNSAEKESAEDPTDTKGNQ